MTNVTEETVKVLERLVSFESVSGRSNRDIVAYVQQYLSVHGVDCSLSCDETGERANVFATIGPPTDDGTVVCGHMDVVPVDGQSWQTDPFQLTQIGDRLFGRGSVDMKGFLACVLACVPYWNELELKRPIHIAFTYDEEIGGFGMPVLLESMAGMQFRPALVIVGEPTEMQIVSGHKGAFELRTEVTGIEAHSCNPYNGVNAISYAARIINRIEESFREVSANPVPESPFVPPFTTFNVGTIKGGTARNATSGWCTFDWEIRTLPGQDGNAALQNILQYTQDELLPEMRSQHPDADIVTIIEASVPSLDDSNASAAIRFVRELTGLNSENVVSFGTDAGYFSDAGFSTVVFGPGDIDRAHKPGEYITRGELESGLAFLRRLGVQMTR